MVEGHSVHRVAGDQRKRLVGKRLKAVSPNKRFTEGAKAINGKKYERIIAIGKNLFAFFEGGHVLHIHFGMSGRWSIFQKKNAPPTTPTTRLVMSDGKLVSHLSCMTLTLYDSTSYLVKRNKLGQDPLDPEANSEVLWKKVNKSKKPISRLLMDQALFAGVGNIFRAEILFVSRTHPGILGKDMTYESFMRVWNSSVKLMRMSFETGRIMSMTAKEAKQMGCPHRRRYVYNQSKCLVCGGRISSFQENTRTVWACFGCQSKSEVKDEARQERATFNSHCAREPLSSRLSTPSKMSVKELQTTLLAAGYRVKPRDKKASLISMLVKHREDMMEHTADLDLSANTAGKEVHGYHHKLLSKKNKGTSRRRRRKNRSDSPAVSPAKKRRRTQKKKAVASSKKIKPTRDDAIRRSARLRAAAQA